MRALWDVAIGPGGNLLATDYNPGGPGSIFRISPSSGNVSTVATGGLLRDPTGIVLDVQGNAFGTDYDETGIDGRVLAVNLGSGSVSLVSTGINLLSPNGITRRSDGTLFIAETGIFGGALGKIVSVDPITGAQQVVASGGLIDHPTDLGFNSAQNLLITDITDNSRHSAVIRLNVATVVELSHQIRRWLVSMGDPGRARTIGYLVLATLAISLTAFRRQGHRI